MDKFEMYGNIRILWIIILIVYKNNVLPNNYLIQTYIFSYI